MSDTTKVDFGDIAGRETFLDRVANGVPPLLAGFEQGWSPKKVKELMADSEFAELVTAARERGIDTVEATLMEKAQQGNMAAIQMVLYNRRPAEWRDVRKIEVSSVHQVNFGEISAAKHAALELLREQGVGIMQSLPAGEIIDAEVIDE